MKKMFSSMKWLILISGITIVILGITLLFTPLQSLIALAIFIGISMIVSGVSEIIFYCGEEKGRRSGWMLASGIISALFGIWTMFGRGSAALASVLPFVFATWVMVSSITRIVGSLSLKSEGFPQWGWVLALGILGAVLGFVLMFSPVLSSFVVVYTIAVMLISYGISNLIIFFRMKKIGDYIRKEFNIQKIQK